MSVFRGTPRGNPSVENPVSENVYRFRTYVRVWSDVLIERIKRSSYVLKRRGFLTTIFSSLITCVIDTSKE